MADNVVDGNVKARIIAMTAGESYQINFDQRVRYVNVRKVGSGTIAIGVDKELTDINDDTAFTIDDDAPAYGPIEKDGNDCIGYLYAISDAAVNLEFKTVTN